MPRARRSILRPILAGLIWGVIGTIASVVLPQVISWPGDSERWVNPQTRHGRQRTLVETRYWIHLVEMNTPSPFGAPARLRAQLRAESYTVPELVGRVTYADGVQHAWWSATENGFPFRCAWAWDSDHPTAPSQSGGWIGRGTFDWASPIPILPIWCGLVLNTLAWGATAALCRVGVRTAVAGFRRRRGLCAHCAYDLRATPAGSPCSECGATH